MSSLAELKEELAGYQNDLEFLHETLATDPDNADALEMKATMEQSIATTKASIAALSSAPPPPPGDDAPPPPPKYDMSKHPKFRKDAAEVPPPPPEESRVSFNTGDTIQAKYSVDKQWYAATIVQKAGSSADPVYTVKFHGYTDRETKRKHEVRPAPENKKRKADGPPTTATVPSVPPPASPVTAKNGTVISAAPSIDPNLVPKREPSKVSDGPTRAPPLPKKLKGNRTLEKSKSSWQDFQKNGPKKPVLGSAKMGKQSQFRTPDLPNAKVGFTGSGKPMSKDQARTKFTYQNYDEPEDD